MQNKYDFKPYETAFQKLFEKEKQLLLKQLTKEPLDIQHIGSTAVPSLGGKGIIDIAIAVKKEELHFFKDKLVSLGYEYKPSFSTPQRLYFVFYKIDAQGKKRRYHIHLTYPESLDWIDFIGFRNYLREQSEERLNYENLKKEASYLAQGDGSIYREKKQDFFNRYKKSEYSRYMEQS